MMSRFDGLTRALSYARTGARHPKPDYMTGRQGVRNLADPIKVDSSNPDASIAQLAVVLVALFAQMERTYLLERVA